jgi:hypothetical protein
MRDRRENEIGDEHRRKGLGRRAVGSLGYAFNVEVIACRVW